MLPWTSSLNRCNGSILKQAIALCKCILLLHPSALLSLHELVNKGTFLSSPLMLLASLVPPHLYVTFLLSVAHNALNHPVCLMCMFSFHLVELKSGKKGERIWHNIKLLTNYCQIMLWATGNLKKKLEWIKENPLASRKTATIMTGN